MCACCASGESLLGSPPRKINMYFSIRHWILVEHNFRYDEPSSGRWTKVLKLFLGRQTKIFTRRFLSSSDFISLYGKIKYVQIARQENPIGAMAIAAVGQGTVHEWE